MKHYGDITKLTGYELPVVDCVTGGSPCQDLSVAGRRAGLTGERSGLFMEQIRIIKEMRENDRTDRRSDIDIRFRRPRYMVWENVPGAYSSNGGRDFQAVLSEIVRIADPAAPDVPLPDRGGWNKSGCLYDEMGKWSIAWRLHDAQFWGVPQRRKRIALVADFGGLSAPEVLFEREGLRGDLEESGEAGEGASEDTVGCPDATGKYIDTSHADDAVRIGDVAASLQSRDYKGGKLVCVDGTVHTYRKKAHPMSSEEGQGWEETEVNDTLNVFDNSEGRTSTLVYENHSQDCRFNFMGDVCETVAAKYGTGGNNMPIVLEQKDDVPKAVCIGNGQADINTHITEEMCQTLNCMHDQMAIIVNENATHEMPNNVLNHVRRLTPVEAERLQGFPDGWTDIGEWIDSKGRTRKTTDSARYKALGNSIALPFWFWLLRRISAQYERPATMGSLFDGIGGFPLCWERCNGKGTAIWASEIEEFPIAVTKKHFPEVEE